MKKPNILLILNDDMGYSDLGCYGGEVNTPNLNGLAEGGLRYTQFYNTARCCPSRASLLTGLHPHQADVGHMMGDDGVDGYLGDLAQDAVTIAEALKVGGYSTYMSGKWHVTRHVKDENHNWPCQRGFDDYYGILTGCANYYQPRTLMRNNKEIAPEGDDYFLTDAISDEATEQIKYHAKKKPDSPFFQYVAYTAPHWPLHAHPEDIEKYKGRFSAGWDKLREERRERMIEMGIIDKSWPLSDRDKDVGPWDDEPHKEWQQRRMEVYAAQIDRMDQGIGRILQALRDTAQLQNTLIIFLADNGGCAEELSENWGPWLTEGHRGATSLTRDGRKIQFANVPHVMPGGEETYQSYGLPWANVSNTPFRLYKHWVHEGGISTPLIAHWPRGIRARGGIRRQPAQLPDIMATFLDVAGVEYPCFRNGESVKPLEGYSIVPTFEDKPYAREVLYWEHEGNCAVRKGNWKLVCKHPGPWELYDMTADRSELNDVAKANPDIVRELSGLYKVWAKRCDVLPWGQLWSISTKK
jgi:arylsulfatase A-like enzyme